MDADVSESRVPTEESTPVAPSATLHEDAAALQAHLDWLAGLESSWRDARDSSGYAAASAWAMQNGRQLLNAHRRTLAFYLDAAGPSRMGVPIEPSAAMLDRAVAFALNVKISGDYGWTAYMRDLWKTMLQGVPVRDGPLEAQALAQPNSGRNHD